MIWVETVNSRGTPASNHVHVAVNVFGPGLHPKDVNVAVPAADTFSLPMAMPSIPKSIRPFEPPAPETTTADRRNRIPLKCLGTYLLYTSATVIR